MTIHGWTEGEAKACVALSLEATACLQRLGMPLFSVVTTLFFAHAASIAAVVDASRSFLKQNTGQCSGPQIEDGLRAAKGGGFE